MQGFIDAAIAIVKAIAKDSVKKVIKSGINKLKSNAIKKAGKDGLKDLAKKAATSKDTIGTLEKKGIKKGAKSLAKDAIKDEMSKTATGKTVIDNIEKAEDAYNKYKKVTNKIKKYTPKNLEKKLLHKVNKAINPLEGAKDFANEKAADFSTKIKDKAVDKITDSINKKYGLDEGASDYKPNSDDAVDIKENEEDFYDNPDEKYFDLVLALVRQHTNLNESRMIFNRFVDWLETQGKREDNELWKFVYNNLSVNFYFSYASDQTQLDPEAKQVTGFVAYQEQIKALKDLYEGGGFY